MSNPTDSAAGLEQALAGAPSVETLFGAILLGTFFGLILYGLSLHQTYRYWRLHSSTDGLFIRSIVVLVLIFETTHNVLTMHACYFYLVTNYFKPLILFDNVWSLDLLSTIAALVAIVSQIFFARRVSIISFAGRIAAITAVMLLLLKMGTSIAFSVRGFETKTLEQLRERIWLVQTALAAASAVDAILAGCLLYVLFQSRAQGEQRYKTWPDLLVMYILNTGLLILVFDLLGLITAFATPVGGDWVALSIIASRLYTNTLLSVLNSREIPSNRNIEIAGGSGAVGRSFISHTNRLETARRWNVPQMQDDTAPATIDIKVTTDVEGDSAKGVPYPGADREIDPYKRSDGGMV